MAKFIYDTKSIMARAWVLAKMRHANYAAKGRRHNDPLNRWFARALVESWAEAKVAMNDAIAKDAAVSVAKKSVKGRYVELLSVAERDGLNHGKSWFCSEREIELFGINPMHEGELVCYVYAN